VNSRWPTCKRQQPWSSPPFPEGPHPSEKMPVSPEQQVRAWGLHDHLDSLINGVMSSKHTLGKPALHWMHAWASSNAWILDLDQRCQQRIGDNGVSTLSHFCNFAQAAERLERRTCFGLVPFVAFCSIAVVYSLTACEHRQPNKYYTPPLICVPATEKAPRNHVRGRRPRRLLPC
jgi:hypothetical protein